MEKSYELRQKMGGTRAVGGTVAGVAEVWLVPKKRQARRVASSVLTSRKAATITTLRTTTLS
jgi:hypothetical protein